MCLYGYKKRNIIKVQHTNIQEKYEKYKKARKNVNFGCTVAKIPFTCAFILA